METAIAQVISEALQHRSREHDQGQPATKESIGSNVDDLTDRVSAWCWLTLKVSSLFLTIENPYNYVKMCHYIEIKPIDFQAFCVTSTSMRLRCTEITGEYL